jgi:hypothetical protein
MASQKEDEKAFAIIILILRSPKSGERRGGVRVREREKGNDLLLSLFLYQFFSYFRYLHVLFFLIKMYKGTL